MMMLMRSTEEIRLESSSSSTDWSTSTEPCTREVAGITRRLAGHRSCLLHLASSLKVSLCTLPLRCSQAACRGFAKSSARLLVLLAKVGPEPLKGPACTEGKWSPSPTPWPPDQPGLEHKCSWFKGKDMQDLAPSGYSQLINQPPCPFHRTLELLVNIGILQVILSSIEKIAFNI